ncbi:MAG: GNAT family N-acetyltransferase [Proteobacteria bacterium]|nr:GNAT family N-acetyltransferase [Pseudomonadota bacterium]
MQHQKQTKTKVIHSLKQADSLQWNLCANPQQLSSHQKERFDPFVTFEFLHALEESDSAVAETGWLPHHLLETDSLGNYLGVIPMYLKHHSMGEYVFDYGWADAFNRAGGDYYPKLQIAIPFTPVTGRRILLNSVTGDDEVETRLINKTISLLNKYQASSLHLTFVERDTWKKLGERGFLQRMDQQFHWQNRDYESFQDFLATLSSKKRRNILRERKQALENDIVIEHLTGNSITEGHWDIFFEFYQETGSRKWGRPYLNRAFFSLIGQTMAERILLIFCKRNGRYVAGALNFIGSDTLFGRYWGCLEHHPCLHFEVCYYQAIEYAIINRLSYVEAGAQGEHKLARGYTPNFTYSAHWIANRNFREAVEHYLDSERTMVRDDQYFLMQHSPYRKGL